MQINLHHWPKGFQTGESPMEPEFQKDTLGPPHSGHITRPIGATFLSELNAHTLPSSLGDAPHPPQPLGPRTPWAHRSPTSRFTEENHGGLA